MKILEKILGAILDCPEEENEDYWEQYFQGKDVLEMPLSCHSKSKNKCKIYRFEDYR